jgi:RNA recognition motif-containing protein
LESIYADIEEPAEERKNEDQKSKEEGNNPAGDLSDEGKLKLFVGGLYFQSESMYPFLILFIEDIREYFDKIAPIHQCTLIVDKSNVGSKGYAFVTLEDRGSISLYLLI